MPRAIRGSRHCAASPRVPHPIPSHPIESRAVISPVASTVPVLACRASLRLSLTLRHSYNYSYRIGLGIRAGERESSWRFSWGRDGTGQ